MVTAVDPRRRHGAYGRRGRRAVLIGMFLQRIMVYGNVERVVICPIQRHQRDTVIARRRANVPQPHGAVLAARQQVKVILRVPIQRVYSTCMGRYAQNRSIANAWVAEDRFTIIQSDRKAAVQTVEPMELRREDLPLWEAVPQDRFKCIRVKQRQSSSIARSHEQATICWEPFNSGDGLKLTVEEGS